MLLIQIHNIHFMEFFSDLPHADVVASGGNKATEELDSIYVQLFICKESRHGAAKCLYMLYNSNCWSCRLGGVPEVFKAE